MNRQGRRTKKRKRPAIQHNFRLTNRNPVVRCACDGSSHGQTPGHPRRGHGRAARPKANFYHHLNSDFQPLADALYRERVRRARRTPPEERILDGCGFMTRPWSA